MFLFTAKRFWYYVSMEGFHMPIGSFWMHNFFVRYDGRTTVKREMWMLNPDNSTTELFTFKLRHFRYTVNDIRENCCLIFSSSFICHWKGKFMCFIKHVLYKVGWLVGWLGFNGPLRQYFSQYRAVSQREGERGEKRIDESKNVQTTPTRTYYKRSRPLPYCNPNCRTPRHWKFTQHHRTTRPPPLYKEFLRHSCVTAHTRHKDLAIQNFTFSLKVSGVLSLFAQWDKDIC